MAASKCIAVFLALGLVGCATKQTPIYETIEVKVPVRIPCEVETPAQPAWVVQLVPREADVYVQMRALLADRELAKGYINELEVALGACKR